MNGDTLQKHIDIILLFENLVKEIAVQHIHMIFTGIRLEQYDKCQFYQSFIRDGMMLTENLKFQKKANHKKSFKESFSIECLTFKSYRHQFFAPELQYIFLP